MTISCVEGAGIVESRLCLYSWTGSVWVRQASRIVDIISNTVTATADHFGLWPRLHEGVDNSPNLYWHSSSDDLPADVQSLACTAAPTTALAGSQPRLACVRGGLVVNPLTPMLVFRQAIATDTITARLQTEGLQVMSSAFQVEWFARLYLPRVPLSVK